MTALWEWLDDNGHNSVSVRTRIRDVIMRTIIAAEQSILSSVNSATPPARRADSKSFCFELFGFDVMLDENLTPYLIEVNTSPSTGTATQMDKAIKNPLIKQVLHLVGVNLPNGPKAYTQQESQHPTSASPIHIPGAIKRGRRDKTPIGHLIPPPV
ncbi:tubulin polyglutamylase TTLL-4, partial [Kipferlia bialata]|eukprot:g12059.t1